MLRVKNWNELYENNRSRTMKVSRWVPVPNTHDGDGYCAIMAHKDAAEIFTAWILILQVASRCQPRGSLVRDSRQAHDTLSLALRTRGKVEWFRKAIPILVSPEVAWLEEVAGDCQEPVTNPAGACQEPVIEGRKEGREGKGRKGTDVGLSPASPKRLMTDAWMEGFKAAFGRPYPFAGAIDGKAADRLVALMDHGETLDGIMATARAAWGNPTGFWCKQGVTLAGFVSKLNQIRNELGELRPATTPKPF